MIQAHLKNYEVKQNESNKIQGHGMIFVVLIILEGEKERRERKEKKERMGRVCDISHNLGDGWSITRRLYK